MVVLEFWMTLEIYPTESCVLGISTELLLLVHQLKLLLLVYQLNLLMHNPIFGGNL